VLDSIVSHSPSLSDTHLHTHKLHSGTYALCSVCYEFSCNKNGVKPIVIRQDSDDDDLVLDVTGVDVKNVGTFRAKCSSCIMNPHRHRRVFRDVLKRAKESRNAYPFLEPVDLQTFPTYLDVVSHPMDLLTMSSRVENGYYDASISKFLYDVGLIRQNCEAFCKMNYPALIPMAQELEKEITELLNIAKHEENLEDVEKYMSKIRNNSSHSRFLIAETKRAKKKEEEEETDGKDVFNIVVRLHNSAKDFIIGYDQYVMGFNQKYVKHDAFHTYVGGLNGAKIVKYQRGNFKDGTLRGSQDILPSGTLPWKAVNVNWVLPSHDENSSSRKNVDDADEKVLDSVNHWDILEGKHYKKWGR